MRVWLERMASTSGVVRATANGEAVVWKQRAESSCGGRGLGC
jgi:hypothetical protein